MYLFYLSIIEGVHIYITNLYCCNYLLFKREIFLCVFRSLYGPKLSTCACIFIWYDHFFVYVKQIAEGHALCLLPAQNRNKSNFTLFVLFFRYISPLFRTLLACRLILIYMQIADITSISILYTSHFFPVNHTFKLDCTQFYRMYFQCILTPT